MSRTSLPPLNALRVFEVAGRVGSFKRAAADLNVTPGAISRQITLLEEFLKRPLFERHHREVTLTPEGQAYLVEISQAFGQLRESTLRLRRTSSPRPFNIWCPMTFSLRWLAPRLPQFQRMFPKQEVSITTVLSPLEVDLDRFDVAIRIGRGGWRGLTSQRLMDIEITPVCSPTLVPGSRRPWGLDELGRHMLLHSAVRPDYWRLWLDAVGAVGIDAERGMRLESVGLAWELAMQGSGVAMGQLALVEGELATGRLVAPFDHVEKIEDAFYLIESPAAQSNTVVQAFVAWVREQAALFESGRRASATSPAS